MGYFDQGRGIKKLPRLPYGQLHVERFQYQSYGHIRRETYRIPSRGTTGAEEVTRNMDNGVSV